ncbi:unnamed protein product [Trichobilharzia regenti]|nr:unnamed protein product [Trichobilharzia regenti]
MDNRETKSTEMTKKLLHFCNPSAVISLEKYKLTYGKVIASTSTLKAVDPIPISFNVDDEMNVSALGRFSDQEEEGREDSSQTKKDGASFTSSNVSSDTKLIKSTSRSRSKSKRSKSTGSRKEAKSHRSPAAKSVSPTLTNNGRRCIVKPVPSIYHTNDYLDPNEYSNSRSNRTNGKVVGRKHLISSVYPGESNDPIPKAKEDIFSDMKTPNSKEKDQTIQQQSNISLLQTTSMSKQASSARNNRLPVPRVAHSILHPLSDPEKARLRLREIERQAQERKREKERKRRHRIAQEKFTIMERLTGQAKTESKS